MAALVEERSESGHSEEQEQEVIKELTEEEKKAILDRDM